MRSVLEFAESFGRVALQRILDADDIEELVDALTEDDVDAVYEVTSSQLHSTLARPASQRVATPARTQGRGFLIM